LNSVYLGLFKNNNSLASQKYRYTFANSTRSWRFGAKRHSGITGEQHFLQVQCLSKGILSQLRIRHQDLTDFVFRKLGKASSVPIQGKVSFYLRKIHTRKSLVWFKQTRMASEKLISVRHSDKL